MRRIGRILIVIVAVVCVLVGVAAGGALFVVRRPLPQVAGDLRLKGLTKPARVYRDAQGIAHIYAASVEDLFFAQGVVHAQDRWWQMEFQRHVGLGRISELTGLAETAHQNDIFIRTVGWNRAAQADVDAAGPETQRVTTAYSAGVNAYIAKKSGPELAVEYALLGVNGVSIPVEPWQPLHSAAWAKALAWELTGNMSSELQLTDIVKQLTERGDDPALIERLTAALYPEYPYAQHPTIIGESDVARSALLPTFHAQSIRASDAARLARAATTLIGQPPAFLAEVGASNSFAIGGAFTDTGKPILGNDPHLSAGMPSLMMQMGLHCEAVNPECPYDVVGFSLPGAPGILVGHNQRITWGLTTPYTDTQDLYMLELDPQDSTRYQVDGEMLPIQVIDEVIKYGDDTPSETIQVRLTRFGPIITDSPTHAEYLAERERPLALRWAAVDQPYDLLGALLGINRAQNWDEFRAALAGWQMPSQNFVYADVEGNIGYQLPGRVPIRAEGHTGRTPIDGTTTANDWRGYVPYEALPRLYNPAQGYIVTANQRIAPPSYNAALAERLGAQFGAESRYVDDSDADYGFRAWRLNDLIAKRIAAGQKWSPEQAKSLQADNYNSFAPYLLPPTLALDLGVEVPASVIDFMRAWDYDASANSGPQALFEMFWARLLFNTFADQLGQTSPNNARMMWAVRRLLDEPQHPWWDNVGTPQVETRDDILRLSFREGYQSAVARMGENVGGWAWGKIHQIKFVSNPLGVSGIGPIEDLVNAGPHPVSGSAMTLNRSTWTTEGGFDAQNISMFRMITDLSDLAAGGNWWINSTGQSGHPASPNYRDQITPWLALQYAPFHADAQTIEKSATSTLILRPD
jgi:penicillin amidase